MMKAARIPLFLIVALGIAFLVADLIILSKFEKKFISLERERIVTSNQLATAKIIAENLNHVRDLVFQNMIFPGRKDSVSVDMGMYSFLTECARDLKVKLIRVQPLPVEQNGRITTYKYDVQMECDFFSFGEFCSKLENNRRIVALSQFELSSIGSDKQGPSDDNPSPSSRRGLALKLQLNTYQVMK
jgi:Tfp pilus assembly protein PilO